MAVLDSLFQNPIVPVIGAGLAGSMSGGPVKSTTTALPITDPAYANLGDLLRKRAQQRLMTSFDTAGQTAAGIQNINTAFNGINDTTGADLTARGLAQSPVAGAVMGNADIARRGNIAQFLNTLPQIQQQQELADLQTAQGVYNTQQTGQTQTSETQQPGGKLGAGLGSAAEMLAFLHGQGLFGDAAQGGGVLGSIKSLFGGGGGTAAGGLVGAGAGLGPSVASTAGLLPAIPGIESVGPALAGPGAAAVSGGGLGAGIAGFLTNPFTIGAAAALVGTKLWMNSQAHRQANKLTGEGGIQFNLNHDLEELANAVKSGQISQQQADPLRQQAFQHWADQAVQFGKSGDKKKVVTQMLSSYDWDPALKDIAAQYRAQLGGTTTWAGRMG